MIMIQLTLDYFKTYGNTPIDQLMEKTKLKLNDVRKLKNSLKPLADAWVEDYKSRKDNKKPQDVIDREASMILTAFVNADLSFDNLSQSFIQNQKYPEIRRNFMFQQEIMNKLNPVWKLYAPKGIRVNWVMNVLVKLENWLLPKVAENQEDNDVMPLIIKTVTGKKSNETLKSNLVSVPIYKEVRKSKCALTEEFEVIDYFKQKFA